MPGYWSLLAQIRSFLFRGFQRGLYTRLESLQFSKNEHIAKLCQLVKRRIYTSVTNIKIGIVTKTKRTTEMTTK